MSLSSASVQVTGFFQGKAIGNVTTLDVRIGRWVEVEMYPVSSRGYLTSQNGAVRRNRRSPDEEAGMATVAQSLYHSDFHQEVGSHSRERSD